MMSPVARLYKFKTSCVTSVIGIARRNFTHLYSVQIFACRHFGHYRSVASNHIMLVLFEPNSLITFDATTVYALYPLATIPSGWD